jgi:hypothetical protein
VVVYLCGDNDIFALGPDGVDSAVDGFRLFVDAAGLHLPSLERIFYLPIHSAPGSKELDRLRDQANDQLRAVCESADHVTLVDYLHLVDDDAFMEDRLHFTPDFYHTLAEYLRPTLVDAMRQ